MRITPPDPSSIMLDAHCHLNFAQFDSDRDAVLARAVRAGVGAVIIAGYDASRRSLAASLATRAGVFACAGIHPWAVAEMGEDEAALDVALETLREDLLAHRDAWCGLGECGLDHVVATTTEARSFQERAFLMQVELAAEFDLPLVIHAVRCHERLRQLLAAHPHPEGGILHGYGGPLGLAMRFVEQGFALSFGSPITWRGYEKQKRALERVAREAPTRWTLETDAPDRPVAPLGREDRGEPAHMREVVKAAAEVLGRDAEEVARQAAQNARAIFSLPEEFLDLPATDG